MDEDANDEHARNRLSGDVAGNAIQAGRIDSINYLSSGTSSTVPRQLPPVPEQLIGRGRQLAQLSELVTLHLRLRRPLTVVLSGMSGVGKSALGIVWAHVHQSLFDGGTLYADLTTYRHHGELDHRAVFGSFLRALGVQAPPTFLPELIALFRTRTADTRVLVVLDDVHDGDNVKLFLPGSAGSTVIATSPSRLATLVAQDARIIDVPPLSPEDSVRLLLGMLSAGREQLLEDGVRELARPCGGLPIALRVLGALIARHRRWTLQRFRDYLSDNGELLARLSPGDKRLDEVLTAATGALGEAAAWTYLVAGLHPGHDFGTEVIGTASSLRPDALDDALDELCEANLLQPLGADRFRMHDLLHLHAGNAATADQRLSGVSRTIVAWYLLGAAAADRAVLGEHRWRLARHNLAGWRGVFTPASGMAWFEQERANLLASVRIAAAHGWDDVVWQLCEALWASYHSREHYAESIDAHELGVTAARRCGNWTAEARMLNQLARGHLELKHFEIAESVLTTALEVSSGCDPRAHAAVLESFGVLFRRQGKGERAAEHFRDALEVNEVIGDARGVVLQCYQLAETLVDTGSAVEAIGVLDRAVAGLAMLNDEYLVARVAIVLGAAHVAAGEPAKAAPVLRDAAETMRARRQPAKELQALLSLIEAAQQISDAARSEWAHARLIELQGEVATD